MSVRSTRLSMALLIAAPFAAAPLSAQGVEYAAGTTKYRISTTTKGTQSSPMGSGNFELGLQQQLTVNLMKHAKDTLMATITIDSIALKTAGPAPDMKQLVGKHWVSLISPTGKFYSTKLVDGVVDPALSQITESVSHFLPAYRGSLAAGTAWSDTVSGKVKQQGLDVDRTIVTNYKVSGDTTIGGEKAIRVERNSNVKAAGGGTAENTAMMMETTGNSTGAFFVTPKGVYLGGTNTDDMNVKITIKQVVQTTTEAIK